MHMATVIIHRDGRDRVVMADIVALDLVAVGTEVVVDLALVDATTSLAVLTVEIAIRRHAGVEVLNVAHHAPDHHHRV